MIKKNVLRILAVVLMLAGAMFPVHAFADRCAEHKFFGLDPWYAGLDCDSKGVVSQSHFDMSNGSGTLIATITKIVGTVVKDLLFFAGMAAVVLIIYGGIQYILSAGNPAAVQKASKTISGAITGLIIAVLAYAIVTAVFKLTTG